MESLSLPKIIFKEGPLVGKGIDLEKPEIILGRDPGADLLIDSPDVSRRHARLMKTEQGYQIEDLGSSNGTFVNGERIAAARL